MRPSATWVGAGVLGVVLLVAASPAPGPALCCTPFGRPPGVSGCLTLIPPPPQVDVCREVLGCSSGSDGCLPGPCTAGREGACPPDEAGQCDDGFDNDANGRTD